MLSYSNFLEKIASNKHMNTIRLTSKKKKESQINQKQKLKHKNPRINTKTNTANAKKDWRLPIK